MATAPPPADAEPLARRRAELTIAPGSQEGQYVVKDRESGRFYSLGEQEHFLLLACDGSQDADAVRAAFEARFGEPLSRGALRDFEKMGLEEGLLERPRKREESSAEDADRAPTPRRRARGSGLQNPLYFRFKLFDPDGLLNLLELPLRFVFTTPFLLATLVLLGVAAVIAYDLRGEWLAMFPAELNWQLVAILWVSVLLATLLHELAHGLTCKHFGGEVHEIGAIMIVGTPCLYCNVSDAWLFSERWKRLAVSLAGGYMDLCVWAVLTLVWRMVPQDTLLANIAWTTGMVCLTRSVFNFNPFLKMDGYYVLMDLLEEPNLYERGQKAFKTYAQHYLWGGPEPEEEHRSLTLLAYGLAHWLFFVSLLSVLIFTVFELQGGPFGLIGLVVSLYITFHIAKVVWKNAFGTQFLRMLWGRGWRLTTWLALVAGLAAACCAIPVQDRITGNFSIRPSQRAEIAAPESGFLEAITLREGDHVSAGTPLARVRIPDLDLNITKKRAEIRESEAMLRRLQAGARPEEVTEQRAKVERAAAWRDLGQSDLARRKEALREELVRMDRQIAQADAERTYADQLFKHAEQLKAEGAISGEQFLAEETRAAVAALRLEEVRAQQAARRTVGAGEAEGEAARREKELKDAQGELRILEAGSRVEDKEAEEARLARLREDLRYLEELATRSLITSPIDGIVTTPRMHEKVGTFVAKGAPVCVVEELTKLIAEITVREDDELGVEAGQEVDLRPRAISDLLVRTKVERKAPSAVVAAGKPQGTVTVYCRLDQAEQEMLSGTTGFAWIYGRERPLGSILTQRAIKYLRTEFWVW